MMSLFCAVIHPPQKAKNTMDLDEKKVRKDNWKYLGTHRSKIYPF